MRNGDDLTIEDRKMISDEDQSPCRSAALVNESQFITADKEGIKLWTYETH